MKGVHAVVWALLTLFGEKCAQRTAVITPRGYNASLDPKASFTFQCDVVGADSIQWLVDGLPSARQDIRNREITESDVIIVDETTGSLMRTIAISRNETNRNTTIICIADSFSSDDVQSDPALFQVQGLLDAPSNLILLEADTRHMRRLTWSEPFSLDITDVDPDISHYRVCYSVSSEKSQCTCTDLTEFIFLYTRVPLKFNVLAVNVVGEGEAATSFHNATDCNNTDPFIINASQVQTRVSFSQPENNPMAAFLFQQLVPNNGINCFSVYKVESSPVSEPNTTNQGIQIPVVMEYNQTSVQLSLVADSDLMNNEQYYAIITDVNANGEAFYNVTIEFDTYDVQSVSGSAIAGGLELSCTFAEGSLAQSCVLTVCKVENVVIDMSCVNKTIRRVDLSTSERLSNLQPGVYIVREVFEVESDGQVTALRRRDVINLMITEPARDTTTTPIAPATQSTGGLSRSPQSDIGYIVGGSITMLLVVGGILIVVVFVIVAYHWHKLNHRNQETPQAVYEEPYDWAVSRLPQTEPDVEQCPAYGVLTK